MSTCLHILQHSLGLDKYGKGRPYRNHFCTGPGSTDYADCLDLVERGLMTHSKGNAITGGDDVFSVTAAGRRYVTEHSPQPQKPTLAQRRYREFLQADSNLRFGEWLKSRRGA